jgi:hypothetical protein
LTTIQRSSDGRDELVDRHQRVPIHIARVACPNRCVSQRDIDAIEELIDLDGITVVAVGGALLRAGGATTDHEHRRHREH